MNSQNHQKEISEIWKILKEVSMGFKVTEQRFKDTEQRFKDLEHRFKDTSQLIKDTVQESKKTDKKIKSLAKLFEDQWGKLMESLIEGGVLDLFRQVGIDVNEIYQRVRKKINGKHMEIDLLLENGTEVIIVEVKTTLRASDIDDFLDRMSMFPEFFNKYQGYSIYGAVAALRIEQAADRYAEKSGLFVVKVGSNSLISLINNEELVPRVF